MLANEEVSPEGTYKETGDPVEKRMMKQWMLRITEYSDRLVDDLEELDWPEPVKKMQREWIGRSHGAEVTFALDGRSDAFTVFTTRPDTLFGATYCVLAPEHELVSAITTDDQRADVEAYVDRSSKRSERDRRADVKDKTGVFTGAYAINPVNDARVPIWIADYVLAGYGTGAIMAVPAHDERDFAFATTFDLPIIPVMKPADGSALADPLAEAWPGEGTACNSGDYDGLPTAEFKTKIVQDLEARGVGQGKIQYALRDWLFSRQRYWGEPFPLIKRADGSVVPVPENELPVSLPHLTEFKPTADGRPPLARAEDWLRAEVPGTDGEIGERETNTMPQWAGSCWYYLRFVDARNEERPWDLEKERYWMPVDLYIGGTEHAVLHLLYARFWHKVLFDLGLVSTKEPFQKLFNQGMIRAYSFKDESNKYHHEDDVVERDGNLFTKSGGVPVTTQIEKMSKSKLNVVNPDDVIDQFGADAIRLYEMFMGPLEMAKPWQTQGIEGIRRFLNRAWRLFFEGDDDALSSTFQDAAPDDEVDKARHAMIAAVTEDLDGLRFNTAISRMMEFVNVMTRRDVRPRTVMEDFVRVLAPFAPHLCEEIWNRLGHEDTLAYEPWPSFDASLLVEDTVTLPVSINGKVRARLQVPKDAEEEAVLKLALAEESVQKHLQDKDLRKVIFRQGKMLNLVV